MARGSKKIDFASENDEIIARLDVFTEYQTLGLRLAGTPRNNKCECYAASRDERKPSAVVFGHTGRYVDKGGTGENLSLFDFAVKYGRIGLSDWRAARKHYADKAGVKLSGGKLPDDPLDAMEFAPWSDGEERLVRRWCGLRNPVWCGRHGSDAYLRAFRMSGGLTGWLRHRDSKKKSSADGPSNAENISWVRDQKVALLPAYGEKLLDAAPVAWIAWDIHGGKLPIYRGHDVPPDLLKMKSVGLTGGTTMGLHGLTRLAEGGEGVERIWSTAGPGDMLAMLAAMIQADQDGIPPDRVGQFGSASLLDRWLVLTNASGETGNVYSHQANLFAGHRVALLRDADEAGEASAAKWIKALSDAGAAEIRKVPMPWPVEKKDGKDVRDFLNGAPVEPEPDASLQGING